MAVFTTADFVRGGGGRRCCMVGRFYLCVTLGRWVLCAHQSLQVYLYLYSIWTSQPLNLRTNTTLIFHFLCHNLNNNKHITHSFWNICCLLKLKIRYISLPLAVSNSCTYNLCCCSHLLALFCCGWTLWHCCERLLVLLIYKPPPPPQNKWL